MPRAASLLLPLALIAAAPPPAAKLLAAQARQAAELAAQAAAQSAARTGAARTAAAEELRLAADRVAAAARLRVTDDAVAAAATRVTALAQRQAQAQAQLDAHAAALGPLLPLIERLALYPAETLLAVPLAPEQAVRGLLVLGGVTRKLQADAAALRAEQAEVVALQQRLRLDRGTLAAIASSQARQAATLDAQIAGVQAARGAAQDQAAAAARRAAAEAARAGTLRDAIAALELSRRAAAVARQVSLHAATPRTRDAARLATMPPVFSAAPDAWTAPVSGRLIRAFGAATDAGPARGLSFATPPNARVVAPCGGRIVFSGPFRSFGLLLIVDCGGETHVVMAGLARLDGRVGQAVQAGEPVGVMAAWDPAQLARPSPSLYVELRRGGQAVNPAALLHGATPHSATLHGVDEHVLHLQRTA